MAELKCKNCWWQEGGKCYVNRSLIVKAENLCEQFLSKREALSRIIPNEKLVILSERK